MTPPGQWLRPPRNLLLALFVVTLVAVSALVWFGGSLLNQERVVEDQHAQERQEQAADRIATKFREALAETGERLGYWVLNPPSDGTPAEGVLLTVDGTTISAAPQHRLLYRPVSPQTPLPGAEASDDVFADGEAFEFQEAEPEKAIEWYRRLADSKEPAVSAGALDPHGSGAAEGGTNRGGTFRVPARRRNSRCQNRWNPGRVACEGVSTGSSAQS
jgi:hypothetical protein